MVWDLTLVTTPNKHFSHALSKDGALSECNLLYFSFRHWQNVRCTVPLRDPNGEGVHRSREHLEMLVNELELGVLWVECGLVGDIVVNLFIYLFRFVSLCDQLVPLVLVCSYRRPIHALCTASYHVAVNSCSANTLGRLGTHPWTAAGNLSLNNKTYPGNMIHICTSSCFCLAMQPSISGTIHDRPLGHAFH
jgi:hypothetical protein